MTGSVYPHVLVSYIPINVATGFLTCLNGTFNSAFVNDGVAYESDMFYMGFSGGSYYHSFIGRLAAPLGVKYGSGKD